MKAMLIGGTGVLSKDVAKQCIESQVDLYMINRGKRLRFVPDGAKVILGDINKPEELSKKIQNLEFDVVIDFLSYTPKQLSRNMKLFQDKCKQYIFISSATVYSTEYTDKNITENTPTTNYNWLYSKNKILCEDLLEEERKVSGLNYTIIRPYITYGDTRIPFAFISKKNPWTIVDRILSEKPIVVWDLGENLCTLTHTEDFAKGVVGLFMNPKAFGQAFHITSDENLTWVDVLEKIAKAVGKEVKIVLVPSIVIEKKFKDMKGELSCDKSKTRKFDNTKIKSVVNDFACEIKFEEGIKKTINYFKSRSDLIKVDHEWNAKVDVLIHRYYDKNIERNSNVFELKIGKYFVFLKNITIILFYKMYNVIKWFFRRITNLLAYLK